MIIVYSQLHRRIEQLRSLLHQTIAEEGDFSSEEVLRASRELDRTLVALMRVLMSETGGEEDQDGEEGERS